MEEEGHLIEFDPRDEFVRFGDTVIRINNIVYAVLNPTTVTVALVAMSQLTGELVRLTLRDNDATAATAYFTNDRIADGRD